MGPLLFLLYVNVNDLSKASGFTVSLFADDTCLILSHDNINTLEKNCNEELILVDDWFKANGLTANLTKASKYMLTLGKGRKGHDLPQIELNMGNAILEKVKTIKYLGVILDEDFIWSAHIKRVKTKIANSVGILSKLRYYVNIETLIQVYHALVGSRLHYAIICWGRPLKLPFTPWLSYKI